MPRLSRQDKLTRDYVLKNGIQKHFTGQPAFVFQGKTLSKADLVALVEEHETAIADLQKAEAAVKAAVTRERAKNAEIHAMGVRIHAWAHIRYPHDIAILADFGTAPVKHGVKSPAVKALAAERMRATRKARHTLGKRQKAKIKGSA
jgi:hypothetical protein